MTMQSYDAVIVGSGYGGSVMAARLSRGRRVLLIERGRRWAAPEFPKNVAELGGAYIRAGSPGKGLWGMRLGKGVGNAFVSGLGGASLVNYGICAQPGDHTFADWPVSAAELAPYYRRALEVLRPTPNPSGDAIGDKAFLDVVEPGRRLDLANTIDWNRCVRCGNCVLGCRHGAKRSLDHTYLVIAEGQGTEVRTETTLTQFRREGDGYELDLRPTGDPEAAPTTVRARELILSAGTFGTLDLWLRHHRYFPLSKRFGRRMSMNGDAMAFLYNSGASVGGEDGAPITTAAQTDFYDAAGKRRTLFVMSGRIPRAVMPLSGFLLGTLADFLGTTAGPVDGGARRALRRVRDLFGPSRDGALAHTFMYKLDAQDRASGTMGVDAYGRAVMDWPDYLDDPILRFAARKLEEWAERVGGRIIHDPARWPLMRSFGVHALGGCGMGKSAEEGVTDSFGRVFNPSGGFYAGLRIVDASIVPTALGVPPSLTIAALAERAAEQMEAEPFG
jgi:cholesterol oxidase